jgi:hypothetical protein
MNKLELFNELCILTVTYPVLLFSGFVAPEFSESLYNAGWLMIVSIAINISVNMLVVFYQGVTSFVLLARRAMFKLRVRRSL